MYIKREKEKLIIKLPGSLDALGVSVGFKI
jgi:hypothetical protein